VLLGIYEEFKMQCMRRFVQGAMTLFSICNTKRVTSAQKGRYVVNFELFPMRRSSVWMTYLS